MLVYNKSLSISRLKKVFFWVMYPFFFLLFISIPDINAQDKCKTALAKAQSLYEVGRSLEVISLLTPCLPDSIPVEQKAKAYELLALAYIAEEALEEGKDTINKLLDTDKNYWPDASLHPAKFVELVQQLINHRKAKKRLRNYILFGSGGIAAAVFIVAVISPRENGGNAEPLPLPPTLPDK